MKALVFLRLPSGVVLAIYDHGCLAIIEVFWRLASSTIGESRGRGIRSDAC